MSTSIEFQELAAVLRRLLKEKKITYRMLGKGIGLSESSVKKLFLAKDCSLARLGRICGVLGISLADLLQAQKEMPARKFRFSPEQEEFLLANERSFHVYWKLVYEEMPGERIRREFALSEAAYFKHLRALDRVGLVELLPGGEVRYPDMALTLWANEGPLVAKVMREWSVSFLRRVTEEAKAEAGYLLALRMFKLRPETREEFYRAMSELFLEFGRRSVREERLYPSATEPLGLVLACGPRSFVEGVPAAHGQE